MLESSIVMQDLVSFPVCAIFEMFILVGSMQVDCALLKTISTVDTQTADGSDDDIGPSCKLQESLADREDVEVTITDTNTNESGSGSNMNTSRSKENLSVLQQIELTGK